MSLVARVLLTSTVALSLACGGPSSNVDQGDPRDAFADDPDDRAPDGEGPTMVDTPPVDEPPVDEPPVDEPPVDEPPVDEPVEPVPLGLIVVDVQETFVDGAYPLGLDRVIENVGDLLTLAGDEGLQTFITYEASTTGSHALHAPLVPLVPADAEHHVKLTFDANGLASFADAIAASGLSRFVVVGAETDVCVLQTVLGLRESGHEIFLVDDGVMSEDPNVAPARARFTQAGVQRVSTLSVIDHVTGATQPASFIDAPVARVRPTDAVVVLHGLDADALDGVVDPHLAAKRARLRELLLISAWFAIPVYAASTTLPPELTGLLADPIAPLADLPLTAQVVVAGTDDGLLPMLEGLPHDEIFLMADALVAASDAAALAALVDARVTHGDVPLTYKTFFYEMTETVNFEDWPADWIARDAVYYPITVAPESLPPIVD